MDKIADIAAGVLTVAIIFVLVRPGSLGPTFVTSVGDAYSEVIRTATGGGVWGQ